ncbi:hypothetical protein BaRGS_00015372 [Batillaria attramentaria]|uniref:Uncharacterized protein n=1 Tax=Batillaria attramentaria TaxID=370345 RepID=A0ABD0L245_9CAEN
MTKQKGADTDPQKEKTGTQKKREGYPEHGKGMVMSPAPQTVQGEAGVSRVCKQAPLQRSPLRRSPNEPLSPKLAGLRSQRSVSSFLRKKKQRQTSNLQPSQSKLSKSLEPETGITPRHVQGTRCALECDQTSSGPSRALLGGAGRTVTHRWRSCEGASQGVECCEDLAGIRPRRSAPRRVKERKAPLLTTQQVVAMFSASAVTGPCSCRQPSEVHAMTEYKRRFRQVQVSSLPNDSRPGTDRVSGLSTDLTKPAKLNHSTRDITF